MSTIVSTRQVRAFRHASDLPKDVWDALLQNEAVANVILPFAKKATHFPRKGDSEQQWFVVYDDAGSVEFVLSCTRGVIDTYPIFVVRCKSPAEEKRGKDIADALGPLVRRLLEEVPPQRVFSVFSTAKVSEIFAEIFEALPVPKEHDIRAIKEPLYDATFTFCTRDTLKGSSEVVTPFPGSDDVAISLRRATMDDLKETAVICKDFSKTSEPYVLDDAGAELEAKTMIENRQAWVHTVQQDGQEEIACLVATTRESDDVTAVTKVFTAEKWRGRGCAARLLHRVCQEILQVKKRVVLYVGNSKELLPARKVYHKIGFQGLFGPQGQHVKGVEKWLEIGFTNTTRGYW